VISTDPGGNDAGYTWVVPARVGSAAQAAAAVAELRVDAWETYRVGRGRTGPPTFGDATQFFEAKATVERFEFAPTAARFLARRRQTGLPDTLLGRYAADAGTESARVQIGGCRSRPWWSRSQARSPCTSPSC
jgi:hypothetical protein